MQPLQHTITLNAADHATPPLITTHDRERPQHSVIPADTWTDVHLAFVAQSMHVVQSMRAMQHTRGPQAVSDAMASMKEQGMMQHRGAMQKRRVRASACPQNVKVCNAAADKSQWQTWMHMLGCTCASHAASDSVASITEKGMMRRRRSTPQNVRRCNAAVYTQHFSQKATGNMEVTILPHLSFARSERFGGIDDREGHDAAEACESRVVPLECQVALAALCNALVCRPLLPAQTNVQ